MAVRVGFTMGSGGGLLKNMCFYSRQRSRRMGLKMGSGGGLLKMRLSIIF